MPKFFSLTIEITDQTKAEEIVKRLTEGFGTDDPEVENERGYSVTACGWCDTASEADYYRAELEDEGKDPLDVIIGGLENDYPDLSDEDRKELAKAISGM